LPDGGRRGPVLLLDAFGLLYRAFFGLPPLTTTRGEPTGALYGLSVLLLKLLREERPAGAMFALDTGRATFRRDAYDEYKAQREAAPTPLARQAARLGELIDAFGVPAFGVAGFEADDVLATVARELGVAGESPLIVTGDRDCLQLARGATRVLYVHRGSRVDRYDEAAVWARFGVAPSRLPDYVALLGDPSDNLPGVPGIGAKTATRLVAQHGTVAGVLEHLDAVEPLKLRAAIAAHADRLPLWADLARLRDDLALPDGPRFAPVTADAAPRLRAWFERMEFTSLVPRIEAALAPA
jgi:DNA polymerase-1